MRMSPEKKMSCKGMLQHATFHANTQVLAPGHVADTKLIALGHVAGTKLIALGQINAKLTTHSSMTRVVQDLT